LLHIGIMTIVRSRERPRFLGLISSALQTRAKAFIFLQDESLQFPAAHKARSNECQRERIKNCQLSRYAYRAEIRFFQFVCMRIRRERERERGEKVGGGETSWNEASRARGVRLVHAVALRCQVDNIVSYYDDVTAVEQNERQYTDARSGVYHSRACVSARYRIIICCYCNGDVTLKHSCVSSYFIPLAATNASTCV